MSQITASLKRPCLSRIHSLVIVACTALFVVTLPLQASAQNVDIHGFISQGYIKSTGNNFLAESKEGSWEFTEIGVNFSTNVTDELRIGLQLFARDLGEMGNLNLELDWAFGDYTLNDFIGIRAGRIKTPYGLYGETQDVDIVRTSVFLPQTVYYLALRDILISFNGLSLYGNIDLDALGSIDYQIFGGAIIGDPGTGPEGSVARFFNNRAREPFHHLDMSAFEITNAVDRWTAGGMLQYNFPITELLLRATILHHRSDFYAKFTDTFFEQINRLGMAPSNFSPQLKLSTEDIIFFVGSVEYTWEDIIFAAEYSVYSGTFKSSQPNIIKHSILNHQKGYAQISFNLSDWSQAAFSLGFIHNPDDPYGLAAKKMGEMPYDSFQNNLTLSLRFDLNPYWIVKVEGNLIDGTMLVYELDNRNSPHLERYWALVAAKTTLTF